MSQRRRYDVPTPYALRLAESVVLTSTWVVYEFVRRLRGDPRASAPLTHEYCEPGASCAEYE